MALTTAGNGIAAGSIGCAVPAGIRNMWAADSNDITGGITFATSGDYVATSISPSGQFEPLEFKTQQAQVTETGEKNEAGNMFYTYEIECDFTKADKTQRRAIQEISEKCNLVLVAELYDGRFMVYGADSNMGLDCKCEMNGFEQSHERGIEGGNLGIVRFMAQHTELAYEYDGSGDSAVTAADKRTHLAG